MSDLRNAVKYTYVRTSFGKCRKVFTFFPLQNKKAEY